MKSFVVLVTVLAAFFTIPALGQSLNVDIGSHFQKPDSAYGAPFGQSGHWNLIDQISASNLVDLSGTPTTVNAKTATTRMIKVKFIL